MPKNELVYQNRFAQRQPIERFLFALRCIDLSVQAARKSGLLTCTGHIDRTQAQIPTAGPPVRGRIPGGHSGVTPTGVIDLGQERRSANDDELFSLTMVIIYDVTARLGSPYTAELRLLRGRHNLSTRYSGGAELKEFPKCILRTNTRPPG